MKLEISDELEPSLLAVFNYYFSADVSMPTVCLRQKTDIYNRIPNLVNAQRRIGIDKNKNWGGEGGGLVGRAAGGTI